jgi:hypothetical protein
VITNFIVFAKIKTVLFLVFLKKPPPATAHSQLAKRQLTKKSERKKNTVKKVACHVNDDDSEQL